MCFDGAVGAARGFGGQYVVAGAPVLSVKTGNNGFVFLIADIVPHCRQNR